MGIVTLQFHVVINTCQLAAENSRTMQRHRREQLKDNNRDASHCMKLQIDGEAKSTI